MQVWIYETLKILCQTNHCLFDLVVNSKCSRSTTTHSIKYNCGFTLSFENSNFWKLSPLNIQITRHFSISAQLQSQKPLASCKCSDELHTGIMMPNQPLSKHWMHSHDRKKHSTGNAHTPDLTAKNAAINLDNSSSSQTAVVHTNLNNHTATA